MVDVLKEDDGGEEDIIIVEDPSQLDDQADDQDDDNDEDDRPSREDEADEHEDEREAIRERRRLEKQERKQRRDEAIKRDKLELDFLRKRNDDLERRLSGVELRTHNADLSQFDAAISQAAGEIEMAEKVIAKAVENGNGADVAKAMRYRDEAAARIQQLQFQKQQVAQNRPNQQPGLDDRVMYHAQEFMRENPWYDAQGRDEDSAIVLAIDQALAKDGYDPTTEDYWDELRARAGRRLPERFGESKSPRKERAAREERTPRGGPAVGSGREHAPASTRKGVYISPERKQALIEAGVWDDPVLRAKYVKRYAEYDKNNRA
jgi:hypothetical protein